MNMAARRPLLETSSMTKFCLKPAPQRQSCAEHVKEAHEGQHYGQAYRLPPLHSSSAQAPLKLHSER